MIKFNDVYKAMAEACKEDNPEGIRSGRFADKKSIANSLLRDFVNQSISKEFNRRITEIAEINQIIKGDAGNEY